MQHAWTLVGVLALGACSKKAVQPTAGSAGSDVTVATGSAAGSAVAVASGSAAGSGSAAAPGCAILKAEDATRLLGEVSDGIESDEEGIGCLYNGKSTNDSVALIVYSGDGNAKYESIKSSEDQPIEIPGVGDHAYRSQGGAFIGLVAHGRCALITVTALNPKTPKPTPDVIADVARTVASRL